MIDLSRWSELSLRDVKICMDRWVNAESVECIFLQVQFDQDEPKNVEQLGHYRWPNETEPDFSVRYACESAFVGSGEVAWNTGLRN